MTLSSRTVRGAAVLLFGASFLAVASASAAATAVPVEWTRLVKATATGNSVQKTAGCGGCPDAGATSSQTISGDGYVEFTAVKGKLVYAGLGTTATTSTDPALINYAFSLWPDGGWDIREKSVYRTEGTFITGDKFRISVTAGVVKYYKNGALVYTSRVSVPAALVLDTTLVDALAEVRNAVITTIPPAPTTTPVTIGTTTLPFGTVSAAYSATLKASGGSGTFAWSVSGALPAGLTLSATGVISGVPTTTGHWTFTVRAADATNAANYADQSLSMDVAAPAPAAALTIVTMSLPSTRIGDSYSATLRASGGTGVYSWTIVAGALPGGLSLDAASGVLQGVPTAGGRFRVTVRATDAGDATAFYDRAFDVAVRAAAPPSVYSAISDRVVRAKGPTPALGPAGYSFTDPGFGSRLLRVTDGAVQPTTVDISYRTPSGTHTNAWSADARYFYVVNTYGTVVPFSFDKTTMSASRLQKSSTGDGGLTLKFFNEPTFSYITPGVMYGTYSGSGSNLHSVDQYDIETNQYSQLLNLETLAPNLAGTYTGGLGASAGAVERIMAFFGGMSQDEHYYLVVFDKANPSRRQLLNTVASTIDGQPTNITLNFKIHAAAIDRSGEFVMVYATADDMAAPRNAAPAYLWDLVKNTITALPLQQAITGGHDGYGYGVRVNQDCCTKTSWDAAQWQFRTLANPFATVDLIPNVLLPKEIYLEDHPSWHNAQPDRLVPFLDANYRSGDNTTPWRAWDEEVFAVQTEGAGTNGTVWRFAHHRSQVASDLDPLVISFWYTPRANVSPDGRWALFTSNWDKTLGTDPRNDPDGRHREDVFLVELSK